MKITSIVENTTTRDIPVEHGLSLFIELSGGKKILFDMGQGQLFAQNAERLGLSISDVDTAIISHGHYDHGGGLRTFLELNSKALVYTHHDAFQPHYSLRDTGMTYIGIDKNLATDARIIPCDRLTRLDDGLTIFAEVHGNCCRPRGNRLLFGPTTSQPDSFSHEQNLIICEGENTILIAGCAHNGIVNIMCKAEDVLSQLYPHEEKTLTHVLAGMHLVKSGMSQEEENAFISRLASELLEYPDTQYYTMHCTGLEQFQRLKAIMGSRIDYLSCGKSIDIS